jgi:ribonucleoside-diphosphate reductase alpha chain
MNLMRAFTYEEALEESLKYFDGDELAASVFLGKYALQGDGGNYLETDPSQMHRRLAKEFARIEKNYPNPMSREEIYDLLAGFKYIVPQGSPMSGIGNNHQIQSLSNCFVIDSPHDSYGGILKTDQEQVQIMKRRGGVGFDISSIRPAGMKTSNAAKTTGGIELFMDRFSNSCREVAQGGRRGALMITIDIRHPQVEDFIKIKRDLTRVTGANISIRLTDGFMNAVQGGELFTLQWPVNSKKPEMSMQIDAQKLWHEIITSAHASAEPGLLFWDTAKRLTPSDVYEKEGFGSVSTNPCGEIILSPYDSCRLMLVNLTSFVDNPWASESEFDYGNFGQVVQKAQRLMDDMIDLEIEQIDKILNKIDNDPEPDEVKYHERSLWHSIRQAAINGRRTGLGITGLGDALAMLGITYGSSKSVATTEKIYKWLAINSYDASIVLAKERGSFPICDVQRERDHPFLKQIISELLPERVEDYYFYGRRNIANTTTAPAGSVSVLTQTTSGIEPAYMLHYTRRKKINPNDKTATIDFVDDSGDKWTEYTVYHHAFKQWLDSTDPDCEWDKDDPRAAVSHSPYSGATSNDIDWVNKVKMQSVAQKWVCHAISNTTNLPSDVSIDTVKDVYMEGWKSGCKGVTVYRDGSRSGVLVSNDKKEEKTNDFIDQHAPKRPETLDCEIHQANIKGEEWTILVGLMNDRPYEVIGGLSEYVEIPKKYKKGKIRRRPRKSMHSKYDLVVGAGEDQITIKDIVAVFDNPNYAGFTRTISLALRHGAPIQYIVEQLQKDKDADLFSFSKVIARCLKKNIRDGTVGGDKDCPKCGAENGLVYQEGCITCKSCGWGRCG